MNLKKKKKKKKRKLIEEFRCSLHQKKKTKKKRQLKILERLIKIPHPFENDTSTGPINSGYVKQSLPKWAENVAGWFTMKKFSKDLS